MEYRFEPWKTEEASQADTLAEAVREGEAKITSPENLSWDRSGPEYPFCGVAEVFTFFRRGRKVQVIASYGHPLSVILCFHSSTCMFIGASLGL